MNPKNSAKYLKSTLEINISTKYQYCSRHLEVWVCGVVTL